MPSTTAVLPSPYYLLSQSLLGQLQVTNLARTPRSVIRKDRQRRGEEEKSGLSGTYSSDRLIYGTMNGNNRSDTRQADIKEKFVSTSIDANNRLVELTPESNSFHPKRKRNRPTVSCMSCKRKKIKCDRMKPMCGACLRNHMPDGSCVYVSHCPSKTNGESRNVKRHLNNSDNSVSSATGATSDEIHFKDTSNSLAELDADERLSKPTETSRETSSESGDLSNESNPPSSKNDSSRVHETVRIEVLLNEIDRLKAIIYERTSGWLLPDFKSSIRAKDVPILKGIRKAHLRNLRHISDRCVRIDAPNYSCFMGPSNFRSLMMYNHTLDKLVLKFNHRLEQERTDWRNSLKPKHFHNEMNRVLENYAREHYEEKDDSSKGPGTPYQRALISYLEQYLVNYDLFIKLLSKSLAMISSLMPIVPHKISDQILSLRFQRDQTTNGVIINFSGQPIEFAQIAMIIGCLKFGFAGIDGEETAPLDGTKKLTIHSEEETNLLYFFATKLLEQAEYRTHPSLPSLLSLIVLYFIACRNIERYDLITFESIPSFQSMTVQMAISLGFHRDINETKLALRMQDGLSNSPNFMACLSREDWHAIWCAVMYMDTLSCFSLGTPSMVGFAGDRCYGTGTFSSAIRYVIGAYRSVVRLITGPSHYGKDKINRGSSTRQLNAYSVTLFQLEKLIFGIEKFNNTELPSFSDLFKQINSSETIEEASKNIFVILMKLRVCCLLLFLYLYTHIIFKDTNDELIKMGRLFGKSLGEVEILEGRLLKRSLRYSIVMLGLLNHLLLNNYSKKTSLLGVFTTDISGVFIKCLYGLASYIAESLNDRKYEDQVIMRVDDLSLEMLELLVDPENENNPDPQKARLFKEGMTKIDKSLARPASLLHYLNSFFYNSSRSTISRDYNFYASYKYVFLTLNYMEDHHLTVDTFNVQKFLDQFKNIDNSWFKG